MSANPREAVTSDAAPRPVGPYSQGVRWERLLFCSGALPVDPTTGALQDTSPADQTRQALSNLDAVCAQAGARLADALRTTIYTTALGRIAEINEVYAEFFECAPPARVTVGVAALPMGAQVEIDAIVVMS